MLILIFMLRTVRRPEDTPAAEKKYKTQKIPVRDPPLRGSLNH